jgi:HEAT repeat protein
MTEASTIQRRRRRIWILLVPLALLLCGLLWLALRKTEPSYQGKPLSRWIRGLEYENVNPTAEQRAALRAMGQPAVTRLIELLEHHDSALKRKFIEYAKYHADIHNRFIAPRYVIPESIYHAEAATALGEIGPAAQAAIPALMAACTNRDYSMAARAKAALTKIRKESIAPLLEALKDVHSTNWIEAAVQAKYLGADGEALVPLLVGPLSNTNIIIREVAADALGGIASRPDLTIPALVEGLKSETDPGIRRREIDALHQFRDAKRQVIPVLLGFMRDGDQNVWLGAAFGLEDMLSPEEKKTIYVPALIQSLNSPVPIIRENAAMFLKRVDPEAAAKVWVK